MKVIVILVKVDKIKNIDDMYNMLKCVLAHCLVQQS